MKKVKAKKEFGQNFLKDSSVLDKIIESMPHNNNHIVEIGPGLGDLTKNLVKYKGVTAYEVDTDLIGILKEKFATEIQKNQFDLKHIDVLMAWDELKSLHSSKYDLIANLPYYIATNIILRAFEDELCEHIVVMVQKEVAEKFTAKVNDKEYSSLAIITQNISKDSKILFDVPPEAFDPMPKVTSSILYIKKDLSTKIDNVFNKFLKNCFSQPRKKLSKNLSSIFDKEIILEIFKDLNINENIRPHELDASLYSQMYTKVKNGKYK
ncbi:Ribosomal RNA small subunit methyltransferase A [Aliarcobacter thereius]|uniref:Ribosomal RNA small subunit methyltransferase A n=2 Tax=Aliarcobacter thereius TaxID=544718 RepID=A0A1C0BA20_9BACT|nr:16S rRNA (adenine(1518)-N(6)/adenine(1519)-N(6))-dimethyltransferase RsmA [Aliarcobacter thereius]OCL88431.1 Ribosomal RNA small subunit methyltransferase A [Aliarcobacter thereius]OCL91921.1 Ribosomal RNA small subunit methyltransferase A [Aliarcobacter thereius]OCL94981.1 Ribosomal RNA small subunit methyltransferase A [Aliarcobacter thereius LMG 24486]OCM00429.1 Ribosomal RNA small subunit methyltransferase A [Aliarcobacter thereius]QBF15147.1 16S rRNA (adenine1518-N6/adenine1519-N6)-dim